MTSPAALHMMRVSASETARRGAAPLRNATAYEQMLVKLAADNRTLRQISSKEQKAEKKRELLPFYLPWVAGVLANGKGVQDDIVMTVMLWRLDANDIAGALEIARYAMTYGMTMPVGRRPTPCLLAEEVALAAQRLCDAKQSPELALLAYFGAMSPEKLALYVGGGCAIFTALTNYWFKRKTYRYLISLGLDKGAIRELNH
ncbi:phage small terminase subunit [Lelliottia amnigena]|nr:phage small terminase subunit [Lelliottia amnigena]